MLILFGCLRRVVGLVVLAAVLVAAWIYRDPLLELWREVRGAAVESEPAGPSPELAGTAQGELAALADGRAERVALGQHEVQSLVDYRLRPHIPEYVLDPRVALKGDRMELRGRVPVERVPRADQFGEIAAFLPDTTELVATLQLIPLDSGRVALVVNELSASRIPIPGRLIPVMLERLRGPPGPGVPADAIALPLPEGADAAYLRRDSLIFVARGRVDREE